MKRKSAPLRWSACEMGGGSTIGLKVPVADRDRYFDRKRHPVVTLKFKDGSGRGDIKPNCDKDSFWTGNCRELISIELKRWLESKGLLDWKTDYPPQALVQPVGEGVFHIVGVEPQENDS